MIEWDLHFSLPAYGFDSIEEYYYVSSCVENLSKIKIPLLVIHAGMTLALILTLIEP